MTAVLFFRYINSIRRIEDHMKLSRPVEWEAMGKPSIFSGKDAEENEKLQKLVEAETENKSEDLQLIVLGELSKRLRHHLRMALWSAFGMYIFTIFAVRYLLQQL
jgi:hypothetical protein